MKKTYIKIEQQAFIGLMLTLVLFGVMGFANSVLTLANDQVNATGTIQTNTTWDFTNNPAINIGAAGTDFTATGGLTLADAFTVTAGGATITAGGLDMTNDAITNIGAAGTDFDSNGGLTLADDLNLLGGVINNTSPFVYNTTTGQTIWGSGAIEITSKADVSLTEPANVIRYLQQGRDSTEALRTYSEIRTVITDNDTGAMASDLEFHVQLADAGLGATKLMSLDGSASVLDMANNPIVNIGAAGTDFNSSGGLSLADILSITPRASAPGTCIEGEIYTDTSGAICYCYTADTWENLGAQGTCV